LIYVIRNIIDRDNVAAVVKGLDIKHPLDITIKRRIKRRTLPQNSLYWLWLTAIQAETGNEKNYLHKYFTDKYLPKKYCVVFGKVVEVSISTTALDTASFTKYLDSINLEMGEKGVELISPGHPLFEQFLEYYNDRTFT
jgi:hypothetical protein